MLSERIRAGSEAAPWVVDEVKELEARVAELETVREPVRWFATQMERKLRKHDDRDGWGTFRLDQLFERLCEEVDELRLEVERRAGLGIIGEAADVANFAMMIADRVRE
jgi:hypothetical protein